MAGTWPEDFFDFAYVSEMDDRLRQLAEMAEEENWSYEYTTTPPHAADSVQLYPVHVSSHCRTGQSCIV